MKKASAQYNRSHERDSAFSEANKIFCLESRKRKADNPIQRDKMLKINKNPDKKLNGSRYFKKDGYFEEDKVHVGMKKNVAKIRILR